MDVYIEPVLPQPELIIAGHGRIAETLARLGHLMNFTVTVHDPSATRENFPEVQRIVSKDFAISEIAFGPSTYVVIATLHKNDHLWLQRALEGEAAYVALIASAHRSRLVLDYFRSGRDRFEYHEPDCCPAARRQCCIAQSESCT